jgi:hypothetical protein
MKGAIMAEAKKSNKITHTFLKDNGKYKNDIVVGINGKFTQIKRGVPVEVDEAVYAVIQQSMMQDGQTADFIEQKVQEFKSGEAAGAI